MKQHLLAFLKIINWYHPLQWRYRYMVFLFQRSISRIRYRKHKGHGIRCVCCQQQYTRFIPSYPLSQDATALHQNQVVAGYGNNIICPYCFSNARERMVRLMVESHYQPEGKKILHFSPEAVVYNWLSRIAQVTTADLQIGFYKHIDKNIEEQDITAMNYSTASFDLVMANHVLEHVPDDISALKEIFRVLKPGGHAILQVPVGCALSQIFEDPLINDAVKQSALFGQRDHVRIYTLEGFMDRLKLVGFQVSHHYPGAELKWKGNGLQEQEPFFLITKPEA